MAENSRIEWCDHTFNHVRGCSKVSPGCAHCYAELRAHRFGEDFAGKRIRLADAGWQQPLKWHRRCERDHFVECDNPACRYRWFASDNQLDGFCERCHHPSASYARPRVFCQSLGDVFEEWDGPVVDHHDNQLFLCQWCGPVIGKNGSSHCRTCDRIGGVVGELRMPDLRRDLFARIDETLNLDWLLLTKRTQNIRPMWPLVSGAADFIGGEVCTMSAYRDNVWLGASVEDQPRTWRIADLLACRDLSPVLFLSLEPLLGAIDLTVDGLCCSPCRHCLDQPADIETNVVECRQCDSTGIGDEVLIDWVIIGCESDGPRVGRLGEFASESAWWDGAARIVEQCQSAGVAVFMKQGPRNGSVVHDLADFPAPCRVREFPVSEARA